MAPTNPITSPGVRTRDQSRARERGSSEGCRSWDIALSDEICPGLVCERRIRFGAGPMSHGATAKGQAWKGNFHSTFFFQAEDGIRDLTVTGVQTCALPI